MLGKLDRLRIGERIRITRIKNCMTQEELADALNVSACYISTIECGCRQLSNNIAKKLHDLFGVSYDYLWEGKNEELDSSIIYNYYSKKIQSRNTFRENGAYNAKYNLDALLDTCSPDELYSLYELCADFIKESREKEA